MERKKKPSKSQTLNCPLSVLSENTMFRVVRMGVQTAYRKCHGRARKSLPFNATEEGLFPGILLGIH